MACGLCRGNALHILALPVSRKCMSCRRTAIFRIWTTESSLPEVGLALKPSVSRPLMPGWYFVYCRLDLDLYSLHRFSESRRVQYWLPSAMAEFGASIEQSSGGAQAYLSGQHKAAAVKVANMSNVCA